MSITPASSGPAPQPAAPDPGGPTQTPAPPPEVRIAAWSWAVSAVPGALAAYFGATADGLSFGDDALLASLLTGTALLVWGARIVLAVVLVRSTPRHGAVARILLVAFGLIASATNDPAAWVRSVGDPLVVALVVLDVMLVVAGTVLLFRPPVSAYSRVAVVPPPAAAPPGGWPAPTNTMAVLALVFAFVFSPLGVVFGFVARHQIKRTGERGSGLALAGLIVGIAYTVFTVGFVVVALVLAPAGG